MCRVKFYGSFDLVVARKPSKHCTDQIKEKSVPFT